MDAIIQLQNTVKKRRKRQKPKREDDIPEHLRVSQKNAAMAFFTITPKRNSASDRY